jgi:hypothetical protein
VLQLHQRAPEHKVDQTEPAERILNWFPAQRCRAEMGGESHVKAMAEEKARPRPYPRKTVEGEPLRHSRDKLLRQPAFVRNKTGRELKWEGGTNLITKTQLAPRMTEREKAPPSITRV